MVIKHTHRDWVEIPKCHKKSSVRVYCQSWPAFPSLGEVKEIPSSGSTRSRSAQRVIVPNEQKGKQHVEGSAKFLRVVHAGDIYQIVNNIHVDELKHSGYKKVLAYRKPNVLREMELEVYCTCRCPDDGKLMVECEGCAEWFHASCLKLSRASLKEWKKCTSC